MITARLSLVTAVSAIALISAAPSLTAAADSEFRMAQNESPYARRGVNPPEQPPQNAEEQKNQQPDGKADRRGRDDGERRRGAGGDENREERRRGAGGDENRGERRAKGDEQNREDSKRQRDDARRPAEDGKRKQDEARRQAEEAQRRKQAEDAQRRQAEDAQRRQAETLRQQQDSNRKREELQKQQKDARDRQQQDDRQQRDDARGKALREAEKNPYARRPVVRDSKPGATIQDIKSARKERREDGGKRLVIEEPDNRVITQQNNRISIERDERDRMRRFAPNARIDRGQGGRSVAIVERGGDKIYTETDERGRLLRRYRRNDKGRESIIIDNRRRNRDRNGGRDLAKGVAIGAGVIAGAVLLDSLVRVPPPRVGIARDKYIVRGRDASDEDYYEALSAPPVEEYEERYTLDEIRATERLRDRMRRIDLDDVTFEFGAWDIDPSQYSKLERLARAIKRVLRRDPDEVFMIEGHTDAVGSRVDNLTLSDRRAETVAYILTQEFEVPFESLVTQGYGEEDLKVVTEAPERLNRRVAARRITPLLARGDGGPRADRGDEGPPEYDRDDRDEDRDDRSDDRGRYREDDRRDPY